MGGCGRTGIYFMSSTVRDVNNNYGGPEIVETRNEGANQLHHKFPLPPPSTVGALHVHLLQDIHERGGGRVVVIIGRRMRRNE